MCTISLVPSVSIPGNFVLTSNRDEAVGRKTIPPEVEIIDDISILLPKDEVAGGSWIGASSQKRVLCLMNGGFKPHNRANFYKKSRGVILKELLIVNDILKSIADYDFKGIEAFTLIFADWSTDLRFFELVWDEREKHLKRLENKPQIWSSSPLYSEEMKKMRERWFSKIQDDLTAENILNFHHTGGIGDKNIDLVVDRGFLKTQSISQLKVDSRNVNFWYKDLNTSEVTVRYLSF